MLRKYKKILCTTIIIIILFALYTVNKIAFFHDPEFEIFVGSMGYDEKEKNTNCYCCDVGNLFIHYEPNSFF